jgi:hypothetical protein
MIVHVFRNQLGSKKVISRDASGSNLPVVGGPWIYEKQMNIEANDGPRIGASSKEIIEGIDANGIFFWPT